MRQKESERILSQLIKENNGNLCVRDAHALGVSEYLCQKYIKKFNFECVAHGIYADQNAHLDELFWLTQRNNKLVASHQSALGLFKLTERMPCKTFVSMPNGSNSRHLRSMTNLKIFYRPVETFGLGITQAKTFAGNIVRTYDRERTICDIIAIKRKIEEDVFDYAIRKYKECSEKNLKTLFLYAEKLGVLDLVREYFDDIEAENALNNVPTMNEEQNENKEEVLEEQPVEIKKEVPVEDRPVEVIKEKKEEISAKKTSFIRKIGHFFGL